MTDLFRIPRSRHEKAAMAHLVLAGFFAFFFLLVVFLLFRDLSWQDPYFSAILIGASIVVMPIVAVNCLIAWGARRKALWARIASIIVAVLAILFSFSFFVMLTRGAPGTDSVIINLGGMLYAMGIGSIFLAFGVYTLVNSKWR